MRISESMLASNYGLDDRVPVGSRMSSPGVGSTRPPFQWVPWAFSPGLKRPVYEADFSSTTSAEVKKTVVYTFDRHTPSLHSA
jgi:hypothetical protein